MGYSKLKFSHSEKLKDPAYLAPEILIKKNNVNEKVDIYSFGVIFWQMFSLKAPYPNLSFDALRSEIIEKESRLPLPECPFVYRRLMDVCLSLDHDSRPSAPTIQKLLSKPLDQVLNYVPKQTSSPPTSPTPPHSSPPISPPTSPEMDRALPVFRQIKSLISTGSPASQIQACDTLVQITKTGYFFFLFGNIEMSH